jgi:hypothetical protein
MTDDLVKRLRLIGEGAYIGAVSDDRRAAKEAANRIEKLEAALREITVTFWDRKEIEQIVIKALNTSQERVKNNGET